MLLNIRQQKVLYGLSLMIALTILNIHPTSSFDLYGDQCSEDQVWFQGDCLSQCPDGWAVFAQNGAKHCEKPCRDDEYLLWTGTCERKCPEPLESYTENGITYCDSPCKEENEYMFPNGACNTFCSQYIFSLEILGRKFCGYENAEELGLQG